MTQNDPATDESNGKLHVSRRTVIGTLGASGVFAAFASAQSQPNTPDGDAGIGGGGMSDEISQFTVQWYDGPEGELPEPGVPGQRYYRITEDGDEYNAGDVLVDEGDSWELLNLGLGGVTLKDTA